MPQTIYTKKLEELSLEQLEIRKVKALEDLNKTLGNLYSWVSEIDKVEWSDRIQWYLGLFKEAFIDPRLEEIQNKGKSKKELLK